MVVKDYYRTNRSIKVEVGEIDITSPFQSVKDAVSLFDEGNFSGEKRAIWKTKSKSADRVVVKETELHLALKELKEQLENAEATKAQALSELDRAKRTIDDLTQKLAIDDSKDSAISATEVDKHQFSEGKNADIHEAEEAKPAEIRALDQIQMLSEKTDAAHASTSDTLITLSKDEYESLSQNAEESERLAEVKVAAAMAQVEAIIASENEVVKRLEAMQKEIEDMKAVKDVALRKAEMSEAACKAVEAELRRWRKCESAAKVERSFQSSSCSYEIQQQKLQEKVTEIQKPEKTKSFLAKKVTLSSLNGVFRKKKN